MIVNITTSNMADLKDTLGIGPGGNLQLFCRYSYSEHTWLSGLDRSKAIRTMEELREAVHWFDSPEYWGEDILLTPYGVSDDWAEEYGLPVASVRKPNR